MNKFKRVLAALIVSIMLCCLLPAGVFAEGRIPIDEAHFPDANFREFVLTGSDYGTDIKIDTDGDGFLSSEEAAAVKEINVEKEYGTAEEEKIVNLKGIEYFIALTKLDCRRNQLTSLDMSKNTALEWLDCSYNQLSVLDISKNTALEWLSCEDNQLTSLDMSKNTALTQLDCRSNQLTGIDVSKNTTLTTFYCSSNQLTSIDVSKNTVLKSLSCAINQLTSIDVSKNTALENFDCASNQLTFLDVSKNTALENLNCSNNQLSVLDISNNTALRWLDCPDNRLTELNVSKNIALEWLSCYDNQLTSLDVSNNTALKSLYCDVPIITAGISSDLPEAGQVYTHKFDRYELKFTLPKGWKKVEFSTPKRFLDLKFKPGDDSLATFMVGIEDVYDENIIVPRFFIDTAYIGKKGAAMLLDCAVDELSEVRYGTNDYIIYQLDSIVKIEYAFHFGNGYCYLFQYADTAEMQYSKEFHELLKSVAYPEDEDSSRQINSASPQIRESHKPYSGNSYSAPGRKDSYNSQTRFNPFGTIYSIISIIAVFILIAAQWKIFAKAGEPGWAVLIPFYSNYVLFKITWGNGWKFLLMLIPLYNIILAVQTDIKLAKAFGKGSGFAAGLIFLGPIFYPILGFGDSIYWGPDNFGKSSW